MNGFTHGIVASKRKRNIGHTTTYFSKWHLLFNNAGSFNKIDGVIIMLFNTCGYCKNIGIENNILRVESYLFYQYFIRACTNFYFTVLGIGLSYFIKSHYNDSRTKCFTDMRLFNKLGFSFLHGNGVHNTFSLYTF